MSYKDSVSPENIYKIQKALIKKIISGIKTDEAIYRDTIDGFPVLGAMYWTKALLETWEDALKDDYKNQK